MVGLVATLAITPLRKTWPALAGLVRTRRLVGLWVTAFVALHLVAYVVLVLGLDFSVLIDDLLQKPYAIAGAVGLLILIPLSVTSTRRWQRSLGRRWKTLHKAVYVVALATWVHVFWQVRSDYTEVVLYALILAVLFAMRWPRFNFLVLRRN